MNKLNGSEWKAFWGMIPLILMSYPYAPPLYQITFIISCFMAGFGLLWQNGFKSKSANVATIAGIWVASNVLCTHVLVSMLNVWGWAGSILFMAVDMMAMYDVPKPPINDASHRGEWTKSAHFLSTSVIRNFLCLLSLGPYMPELVFVVCAFFLAGAILSCWSDGPKPPYKKREVQPMGLGLRSNNYFDKGVSPRLFVSSVDLGRGLNASPQEMPVSDKETRSRGSYGGLFRFQNVLSHRRSGRAMPFGLKSRLWEGAHWPKTSLSSVTDQSRQVLSRLPKSRILEHVKFTSPPPFFMGR